MTILSLVNMRDGYLGENLIFIISQPRSGSTLLQRVLAGHPDILTSAETWLMLHPLYGLRREGVTTEYESAWARTGVKEFLTHYTDGLDTYDQGIRAFSQTIYGNALNRAGKTYFLDKTPRYYYVAQELYRVLPKAQFIFLLRNPMAVLASELNTYVKDNLRFLSAFRDDLLLAPQMILDAIDHMGSRANVVHYETFVRNPANAIANLCERLGLDYHQDMLSYADTPAPQGKMNDPVGIHRHASPSTASVDRWKEMADDSQKRHFAMSYLNALGPATISKLGYSYEDISHAISATGANTLDPGVFPWSIAITQEEKWSMKQRMRVRHRAAVAKWGLFVGTVVGILTNGLLLARNVQKAIGVGSSKA